MLLLAACLHKGAVLSHSGGEWDAKCSLWIPRGQPNWAAGGETPSPRETNQPGCEVIAEGCKIVAQWKNKQMWLNPSLLPFRFEPDILLRAKQEFLKTDSATDLEWVFLLTLTFSLPAEYMSCKVPKWKSILNLSLDTWRSKAKPLSCRRENWFQRESTKESLFLERRNVG